jgi:two-component system, NtrC family, sensor histidine kinase HydH
MFRVKASRFHSRAPITAAILTVVLALDFALSAAAVYQVSDEYRLLGSWLDRRGSVSALEITELRQEIGTRIIVRSTALAVLVLCTVATLWLQQRQFATQRTLHQVRLLSSDILASMDQGVITTDPRKTITSINSAAIWILGVESDCVGQPLARIAAEGLPLVEMAGRVAERNAAIWDQDFAVEKGGRVRRVRSHAHVLKDADGGAAGCLFLLRDFTDRVLIEERIRRMERFLSLGTLASGLHHEIKNPLTALSIHVQLLEKRLREPDQKKRVDELLGVVKSEVMRLNGVLESFRDFASLRRLVIRPAGVHELLDEVVHLVRPQAEGQHVDLTLKRPEVNFPRVPLDAEKIKQAVLNLVINALEAMPEGGDLVLGASASNGELVVDVTDTGPGIPPEIQKDLFKPYFSTKDRGTGMGLALTEKLVGQHGGRIDLRTSPSGTTFSIVIPLEPAERATGGL